MKRFVLLSAIFSFLLSCSKDPAIVTPPDYRLKYVGTYTGKYEEWFHFQIDPPVKTVFDPAKHVVELGDDDSTLVIRTYVKQDSLVIKLYPKVTSFDEFEFQYYWRTVIEGGIKGDSLDIHVRTYPSQVYGYRYFFTGTK